MVREIREVFDIKNSSTSSEINFNTPWSINLKYSQLGNKWDPILEGTNSLINNDQSLTFTYFDNSGNSVVPESASKVHINLQIDFDKYSNLDITLNRDINLRNFGLK